MGHTTCALLGKLEPADNPPASMSAPEWGWEPPSEHPVAVVQAPFGLSPLPTSYTACVGTPYHLGLL